MVLGSPPSPTPLPLPNVETCLAYAALGRLFPDDVLGPLARDGFNEVRARWLAGLDAAERRRREQGLLDKIMAMRPPPKPKKLVFYLGLACRPAVAALMRDQPSE